MMAEQPPTPARPRLELARPPAPTRDDATMMTSGEREVGKIVADVWENAEKLVRQELELGLAEIDRRVDKLKTGLVTAAIGAAVLYAGVLVLLAAVVMGLATVMAPWIAALVVGVIVTGAGAFMSQRGTQKAENATKPDEHLHRTVNAMKEVVR
jgi:hypothetical protein